jgi:hypothetical protein
VGCAGRKVRYANALFLEKRMAITLDRQELLRLARLGGQCDLSALVLFYLRSRFQGAVLDVLRAHPR